jgi:hypothetical protein
MIQSVHESQKRMNNSNDITITIQDSETKEKVSLTLIGYAINIRKLLEIIKGTI